MISSKYTLLLINTNYYYTNGLSQASDRSNSEAKTSFSAPPECPTHRISKSSSGSLAFHQFGVCDNCITPKWTLLVACKFTMCNVKSNVHLGVILLSSTPMNKCSRGVSPLFRSACNMLIYSLCLQQLTNVFTARCM
jgi:hypothetical protein